jgi:hypothetical protein
MLRSLLPLSRSRVRGRRREANAQIKVEVKGSASESHDEACSPAMGTPLLQQISLMDNGVPLETQEASL